MRRNVLFALTALSLTVGAASALAGRVVVDRLAIQPESWTSLLPAMRIVAEQTDHGLFRSTYDLTLQLGCLPRALDDASASPEPLQVVVRHVVHHGPVPGGTSLGLAAIDSELRAAPPLEAKLEQLFHGEPMMRLHTQVGFSGATVTDFAVPALALHDDARGTFTADPLLGQVRAPRLTPGASAPFQFSLPGARMQVRTPEGQLVLTMGPAQGDATPLVADGLPVSWAVPSSASGTLASLSLDASVAAGTTAPALPFRVRFEGVSYAFDSKLADGLLSTTNRMRARGQVGAVAVDKIELTASMKRLHAETYQRMMQRVLSETLRCDAQPTATTPSMLDDASAALWAHDPEWALDSLAIEIQGRRAELSYSLGVKGITPADLKAKEALPALLIARAVARGSAKVHVDLLSDLVERVAALSAASPATQAAEARAMVELMTAQLSARGYVVRDGPYLATSAAFENGALRVNGQPFALPPLGAALAGP